MAYRTRSAVNHLLRNPSGPVGRHLQDLAEQVREEAERIADIELEPRKESKPRKAGEIPYRGNFRAEAITQTPKGPKIRVTNDAGHAIYLERGTEENYPIVAVNAPELVFFWERKNRIFRGVSVIHPGIRGHRIMERALDNVIKRNR